MRILVLGDIHGNLEALRAVLDHAKGKWDECWFLGDVSGYGPKPVECLYTLLSIDAHMISGNHDIAVSGGIRTATFSPLAEAMVLKHRETLGTESKKLLASMPHTLIFEDVLLCHGSPGNPVWEYICNTHKAEAAFRACPQKFILFSHTHIPVCYTAKNEQMLKSTYTGKIYAKEQKTRYLFNPGSVGQPRDRDPRASYALFDTAEKSWEVCRVSYDIEKTKQDMVKIGAPSMLINRLSAGC